MLVGAQTQEDLFKPIEGKRLAQTIAIATMTLEAQEKHERIERVSRDD